MTAPRPLVTIDPHASIAPCCGRRHRGSCIPLVTAQAPAPPVEDGECWAPEEDYGLQGGQGREPRDLDAAAGIMAAVGLMLLVAFAAGVAWWALFQLAVRR